MLLNRPLVVFGPSGVGKGTLLARLFADFPDTFGFSISHTTRQPRPGETDGKEYHFVSTEKFSALLADHVFIEHAQFSANFYGTSRQAIAAVRESGRRCVLDIDSQGVRQVKETDLNPVCVFISPPDMSTLRRRLRGRGTDGEDAIQRRLTTALAEIEFARQSDACDCVIVNDDLDRAYASFQQVALGQDIESDVIPPLDD
ncbi:P-loop containing nucleoside triphosphate hydrolase protein [Butyriboletus roseoflavus]|nr:P-loop containing nucleoside triphosphate hydrolase protein [Butyriboletus roseoflavus]